MVSNLELKDYYLILDVPRTASPVDIKAARRILNKKYHPDFNPGDKGSEARCQEVNDAYDVLSDPETRKVIDDYLRGSQQEGFSDQGTVNGIPKPGSLEAQLLKHYIEQVKMQRRTTKDFGLIENIDAMNTSYPRLDARARAVCSLYLEEVQQELQRSPSWPVAKQTYRRSVFFRNLRQAPDSVDALGYCCIAGVLSAINYGNAPVFSIAVMMGIPPLLKWMAKRDYELFNSMFDEIFKESQEAISSITSQYESDLDTLRNLKT